MELLGKIKLINETQSFGTNNFTKRDIVITTDDQYPQMILVEFVQDKCSILDSYNVGDDVKININIRGREWINPEGEAKYFNAIQGWRIEKTNAAQGQSAGNIPPASSEEPDDLPF